MHVGILMWRGTRYYDVAAAMEVFSLAFEYQQIRRRAPAVLVDCTGVADCEPCSPTDGIVVVPMDGSPQTSPGSQMDLEAACHLCDILIIPGFSGFSPDDVPLANVTQRECLEVAHRRGAAIVSLCTGAFWLASTGLLDAVSLRPIGNIPVVWRNSGPLLPCVITCCSPSRMTSGLRRARVLQRMLALNWCANASVQPRPNISSVSWSSRVPDRVSRPRSPAKRLKSAHRLTSWRRSVIRFPETLSAGGGPVTLLRRWECLYVRWSDCFERKDVPRTNGLFVSGCVSRVFCWKPPTSQWKQSPIVRGFPVPTSCADISVPSAMPLQRSTASHMLDNLQLAVAQFVTT